ncbi:dihydrodipicolinate synthase family protein [Pseudoxanthobacter sp. M-2]|uniref:dihydrodipicolinate synthase family protein n=1 Tax=Pseudoxanthobacter sp. M-2 TaxID=3078754 RepID=UPI0038FCFDB9
MSVAGSSVAGSDGIIRGVIAPNLTPFDDALAVVPELYVAHAQHLLANGCAGLAPFGTTGEALSVGIDERKRLLEALVEAGVDPKRLIPGTGLCSFPDTAELTRHAVDLGCAGAMTLPPFYFKGVSDDGLYAYFEKLIEAVDRPALRIYLYHIPPVSQTPLSLDLVGRLAEAFPETVVGLKDSSGDAENTRALLARFPKLAIYPGSEIGLDAMLALGAPGCITATANLNAPAVAEVVARHGDGGGGARQAVVDAFRKTVQPYAPIPAMKAVLAETTGDRRWRNVRPPLLPAPVEKGRELLRTLEESFGFAVRALV